ncbi:hypothetical protein K438DRAFT_1842173 [Mycena galopus ATCC 62051]|nr:hypothetical protein K438DRAFT_1842173 [Mycena galopus ATCC 62051]
MSNPCRGTRRCCEDERNPLWVTRIGASGYRIGVGVASQEPERRNPPQGSRSQGKGQRIGVLVLSSERGAKARPEQRDDDESTPCSSPRTKQSSQSKA